VSSRTAGPADPPPTAIGRRRYLDWLRGVAVLIMIEAHTLDSWTRAADRSRPEYGWAIVLGGFGAPIFLFLAGIAVALAAGSRLSRGVTAAEAAARARRRGWQILGLAFLFRLQSLLVSGGSLAKLVKVDILNVMGVAMLAAALIWGAGRRAARRGALLALAAVVVAMVTPLVRATSLLDPLPDVVEWYIRTPPGRTMFNLFPWAAFLLAGAALGVWLDRARTTRDERRLNMTLAVAGPAIAAGAYAASFLPAVYAETDFWTSSPAFFFLRLGILVSTLPIAYGVGRLWRGRSRLEEFGVASLFVYWVHVEMVYGLLTLPIHRRLTFEQALAAAAVFAVLMFWLVKLKNRLAHVPAGVVSGFSRTTNQSAVERGSG
jgi:uncharacterized membrane protein